MKHTLIGFGAGAFAFAVALMALPNVELPCEITVEYSRTEFKPFSMRNRGLGQFVPVQYTVAFKGLGRVESSRLICKVKLDKTI